ncbi:hypothetical protein BH09ACT5_BH09ACT5_16070 [soil metagenome]
MKLLVYGAGVLGTTHAARLHEAGHDVSLLARGARLDALQEHGVLLAEGESPVVRRVDVPVISAPAGRYDLILVLVRAQQVGAILETLAGLEGDVLFLVNWAAGPGPLVEALGERVLLGFPAFGGGVLDGDVVRYGPSSPLTRLVTMPIGEPDGSSTPRLGRIVELFRAAGIRAKAEPRMDAWLRTHAAVELPLGQATKEAGGPRALAERPGQVREMLRRIKQNVAGLPAGPVPRAFGAVRAVPEAVMVPVLRAFLRSSAAGPLNTVTPAALGELDLLAEQLRR